MSITVTSSNSISDASFSIKEATVIVASNNATIETVPKDVVSLSISNINAVSTDVSSSLLEITSISVDTSVSISKPALETISVPGSKGQQGPIGLPGNSSSITSLILPTGQSAVSFSLDLLQYRSTTLFVSCIDITNDLIHKEFTIELSPNAYTVHSITTSPFQSFGVPVSLSSPLDCILTNNHSKDLSIKILDLSIER